MCVWVIWELYKKLARAQSHVDDLYRREFPRNALQRTLVDVRNNGHSGQLLQRFAHLCRTRLNLDVGCGCKRLIVGGAGERVWREKSHRRVDDKVIADDAHTVHGNWAASERGGRARRADAIRDRGDRGGDDDTDDNAELQKIILLSRSLTASFAIFRFVNINRIIFARCSVAAGGSAISNLRVRYYQHRRSLHSAMDHRSRNREYSREYRARQQAVKAAALKGAYEAYSQLDKKLKQLIKRMDKAFANIERKIIELEKSVQLIRDNAVYLDPVAHSPSSSWPFGVPFLNVDDVENVLSGK